MRKVLLIDDSSLSRAILKRSLGVDYEYIEADDGMRGLELYFVEKPDLVVLDLTMPGVNGLDILKQIRELDPGARVIIGTADIQEFTRNKADELGAVAYLNKPFTPDSVRNVVKQVLER